MAEETQTAEEQTVEAQAPEEQTPAEPSIKGVQFPQFDEASDGGPKNKIGMILDISVPVAVQLGRTEMLIEDVLALGPGAVVELDKMAGEPVDILVHNKIVAQGEVVVVDEFSASVPEAVSAEGYRLLWFHSTRKAELDEALSFLYPDTP